MDGLAGDQMSVWLVREAPVGIGICSRHNFAAVDAWVWFWGCRWRICRTETSIDCMGDWLSFIKNQALTLFWTSRQMKNLCDAIRNLSDYAGDSDADWWCIISCADDNLLLTPLAVSKLPFCKQKYCKGWSTRFFNTRWSSSNFFRRFWKNINHLYIDSTLHGKCTMQWCNSARIRGAFKYNIYFITKKLFEPVNYILLVLSKPKIVFVFISTNPTGAWEV